MSAGLILFSWAGEVYAVPGVADSASQSDDIEHNSGDSSSAPRKGGGGALPPGGHEEELQRLWVGHEPAPG